LAEAKTKPFPLLTNEQKRFVSMSKKFFINEQKRFSTMTQTLNLVGKEEK